MTVHEMIQHIAYCIWELRGRTAATDAENWQMASRLLHSKTTAHEYGLPACPLCNVNFRPKAAEERQRIIELDQGD